MITTCTECGGMYEAGSEEQAYEAERLCFGCRETAEAAALRYELSAGAADEARQNVRRFGVA